VKNIQITVNCTQAAYGCLGLRQNDMMNADQCVGTAGDAGRAPNNLPYEFSLLARLPNARESLYICELQLEAPQDMPSHFDEY